MASYSKTWPPCLRNYNLTNLCNQNIRYAVGNFARQKPGWVLQQETQISIFYVSVLFVQFTVNIVLVQNEYLTLVFLFLTGLSVRISPKTFTQYRDQDVVFYCYVTGNPAPIVSWYSNGQDITHDSRLKMTNVPGGYLMRLGPLHPLLDNGTLECRGNNAVNPPVTDKAELHVLSRRFRKFSSLIYCICVYLSSNENAVLIIETGSW